MKDNIKAKIETLNNKQLKDTEKFIENLTKKNDLPEILQIKLDGIKNNPIAEPKIAAARDKIVKALNKKEISTTDATLELIEAVYTIEEIEEIEVEYKLEIKDLIKFGNEIALKVFGKKELVDGEEVFKEIESQNDLRPIPYSKKRKVRDAFQKVGDISQKALNELKKYEGKDDVKLSEKAKNKVADLDKKMNEAKELLDREVNSAHNLDTSDMTEWEKELLHDKVVANCFGNYIPPMGKN